MDRWEGMMEKLDRLTDKLAAVEQVQHQLLMQSELSATMATKAAEEQVKLAQKVDQAGKDIAELRLEQLAKELETPNGGGQDRPQGGFARHDDAEPSHRYHDTFQHRPRENWGRRLAEHDLAPLPKFRFPMFEGVEPKIWLKKCVDYFQLYNVPQMVWVTAASLHMEENAARWFQMFSLQHGLTSWDEFAQAVLQKFGAEEYSQAMQKLLELQQKGSVEDYARDFEIVRFATTIHNKQLDETMFVAHFIKGLKPELQGHVQSHLPVTVDRAALLAKIQQAVLAKQKQRSSKFFGVPRGPHLVGKTENATTEASQDLTEEKWVREYRRQNGLCFTCGDKFEPGHQNKCPKRVQLHINALSAEELHMTLSDDVLAQIEQEEQLEEDCHKLSLHAISGTASENCMGVRALLHNQVLLILVDSGSSVSFISQKMVDRLKLVTQQCTPVKVKVANGQILDTNRMVMGLEWWASGHTFKQDMRVLGLDAYDAILGYDWLRRHSPMQCDWDSKILSFEDQRKRVQLCGIAGQQGEVLEVTSMQLEKWVKGNDIWALALLETTSDSGPVISDTQLQQLLQEFQDIFATPTDLPPSRPFDHHIPLIPGSIPVNSRPYRYSPFHKTEIEKQVAQLLENGLIVPSVSPFASPVLLVQKKDGSWRFCVDYRKLNSMTIKNRFPMPVVEEIIDELAGTQFFSSMDMTAGHHQVRMGANEEYKTAFKTHQGHFQFRVMPFGLTNAPATFQCAMNMVLAPFLRKFVMVFLDDILVYSPDWHTHLQHLKLVFEALRGQQFYLKMKKCAFGKQELVYLGHIISSKGVATDPLKTAAMNKWPQPTNVTELRGFLGLTGYYRRFVRHYGTIARPLTNLLKKGEFLWSEEAAAAFNSLKQAMASTPVLALADFEIPFVIETDACDEGLGAVIMQQGRPIAYLSKALGAKNKQLSIYEKEFLAVIMAVDKWRSYLHRTEFEIRTDHKALSFLGDQELHSDLQRKAMTKLMGLQFKVVYKQGKDNVVADALSRLGHMMAITMVSEVQPIWLQEVLNSYVTDEEAQELLAKLTIHSPDEQGFSLLKGLIRKNGLIWLGHNSALQTKIVAALHDSVLGGHSGIQATYYRVKKLFIWRGMKADVENFVRQCQICQQAKAERTHPAGLLQPLSIPKGAWQDITMDFIEKLPKSEGYDTILVVVDRFSKYAHFLPLKHPFSASQVAQVLLDNVIKLHGLPMSMVSDRDKIFTSSFWTQLFKIMGTKLSLSTAYHSN